MTLGLTYSSEQTVTCVISFSDNNQLFLLWGKIKNKFRFLFLVHTVKVKHNLNLCGEKRAAQ